MENSIKYDDIFVMLSRRTIADDARLYLNRDLKDWEEDELEDILCGVMDDHIALYLSERRDESND